MKTFLKILAVASLLACPAEARHRGNPNPPTGGGNFPATYWAANFSNFPASPSYFPVMVWAQKPCATGAGGSGTLAAQMANTNINTQNGMDLGTGSATAWPKTFGADNGELNCLKAASIKLIAGGDPYSNVTATSVASALSLATTDGYLAGLIGYLWTDEPGCGFSSPPTYGLASTPTEVSNIHGFDGTRPPEVNMTPFPPWTTIDPFYDACPGDSPPQSQIKTAFLSAGFTSFDMYPWTDPYFADVALGGAAAAVEHSDFATKSNDFGYLQGLGVANSVVMTGGTKPVSAFVEVGANNLGQPAQFTNFTASVSNGSNIITLPGGTTWTRFSAVEVALHPTVSGSGIPGGATLTTPFIDSTHAHMTVNANANNSGISVALGGLDDGPCSISNNTCYVSGNEYRATPVQAFTETWLSIVSGANLIQDFCQDTLSLSYCLGDPAGGANAAAVQANLKYINGVILNYAAILNAPTVGICSNQNADGTISATCNNGILTLHTGSTSCPGAAIAKSSGGFIYVFVQTDRNSTSATNCGASAGTTFTYTLSGVTGTVATVDYDQNIHYDAANDTTGATHSLSANAWTDTMGDHGDSYRLKVYKVAA